MRTSRPVVAAIAGASLVAAMVSSAPAAAAVTTLPSSAPEPCAEPAYQTFGAASLTGAIVGAVTIGDRAYVVTRGLKPPLLAEIDLTTHTVIREARLPDGPKTGEPEGAWATTVSAGRVYLGTYPVPDLYRFDPATGQVEHLHSFGNNGGYVWSLDAALDGTVYAGTYPDGKVWEYAPSTGTVRDLGRIAADERYARAIAVDATTVYAGALDKRQLIAIDRVTGEKRVLASGGTGFGAVAQHGDRVLAASGSVLFDVRKDGTDLRTVSGVSVDSIAFGADGTAYLSSRPYGTVYAYRTGDDGLTELGTPRQGEETRRLVPSDGALLGFSGSGGFWTMDLGDRSTRYTDLLAAGLTPGSERPQSILLDQNKALYIGGHFAITVRNLRDGTQRRVWVGGEPKAMTRRGNKIYAALYPSSEVIELDRRTLEIRSLGFVGHGQSRPWDLEYDPVTDKLLIASAPTGANLQGALTVVDPDTGDMQVYVDVIPDQSLMSLSVDSAAGIVYLGGDVLGGGGTPPVHQSASVAAFDLRTRTVLWQVDPVAGYRTFQDVKVHDGKLYGVYKRDASWFVMDLATRRILRGGPLAGYGEIQVHRGQVFTSTYFGGGNVYLLSDGGRLLATGLGDEWYTNPDLAFEPGGWHAWALVGRDLARIRLDPACPPLTISNS